MTLERIQKGIATRKEKGVWHSEETKQKMRKPKTGKIGKGIPWTEARRLAFLKRKDNIG